MKAREFISEAWSQKYKSSINCSHPKGFSQRAHCAGKKKHNESVETEMVCEDCGMCQTHGNLNEIKKGQKDSNGYTRCWPGKHAEGTKTGKNGGQVRNCVPNESIAEDDDAVAAFVARGGEIQQLKPQRGPKRSGVSLASKHIGSGSGRGTTKGKVSGLGANTGKSGKPVVTAEQGMAEGFWGDFKTSMKKSGEVQAFYVVPKFLDSQITGLIKHTDPDPNLWNMLKKDIADLPNDVQLAVGELVEEVDLEISHWPRRFLGGSANTDIQRTKNLIAILRKIKNIVELNDPSNKKQGVAEGICSLEEAHEIFDDFEQAMAARGLTEDVFETITDEQIIRETAAWRRKEGKSAKGGLNRKGVASYRRENPGSKLQMAVTTKPSKLKPGSKSAKRRKSFCARMSGVKGPMKKPNGKPTRKALALRKWNC